jgi:serine/threonine protein kinase
MEALGPADPVQVGPYRLVGRLGEGGMGRVFLGRSPGGRPVAVKMVRPEYAADSRFRQRFAAEVEAARRVGGFFTAQVVDAGPDDNPPWLVTAYVAGPSLQTAVREHGPLPVETVRALGAGLAEGLMAIHASGVVHRDLKPSNIIIASDGPRVIDFGIARALEMASLASPSVVLGTPSFMSPEQVLAREHGPPGDVFALGSVLTFAATGRGAFGEGHPWAVLNNIVQAEPDLAEVPDETLRDVIAACLAKEPEDRPGLEELLTWLLDPTPAPQAWLPPAVRDLADSYATHTPAGAGSRPAPDIEMEPYDQFVWAARRFQEQPDYVRARHRDQLNDLAVKLSAVLPIVEEYPKRRSHHYADALGDVRLYVLNLSHFLGLDRRLPDTSSRDLARVLWKTIDQFIEMAGKLEPIRQLSDAHARNVARAFAEASTALSAAADVNVPDAGSIFDDHN